MLRSLCGTGKITAFENQSMIYRGRKWRRPLSPAAKLNPFCNLNVAGDFTTIFPASGKRSDNGIEEGRELWTHTD